MLGLSWSWNPQKQGVVWILILKLWMLLITVVTEFDNEKRFRWHSSSRFFESNFQVTSVVAGITEFVAMRLPTKQHTQCRCLPHLSCVRQSTEQEPWRVPFIKPRLLSLLINAWYFQWFGTVGSWCSLMFYFQMSMIIKLRGWSHQSILELRFFSQPPGRFFSAQLPMRITLTLTCLFPLEGRLTARRKVNNLKLTQQLWEGFHRSQYLAHICTTHGNRVRMQLRGVQNSQKVKQWSHKEKPVHIHFPILDSTMLHWYLFIQILAQIRPSWE